MSETPDGRPRAHSEDSASSNLSNLSSSSRRAPDVPSFRFRRGASSRSSKDLTDELSGVDVALYKEGVPKGKEGNLQAGRLGDSARDPYEGPSHTTTEDYAVSHQGGAGESEEIDLLGPRPAGGEVGAGGATLVAGGIARSDEYGESSDFSRALGEGLRGAEESALACITVI